MKIAGRFDLTYCSTIHAGETWPEVRAALARQSSGLAEELVGGLRSAARSLDDRLERLVRRRAEARPSAYGGLAARGLAAAVDLALTVVPLMAAVGVARSAGPSSPRCRER